MPKVNIAETFKKIEANWQPHIVGELNGQFVKLGRFDNEFVWHSHETEDELFLVTKGRMRIELRDEEDVELGEGEFYIVQHGVEHRPVALPHAEVLLFEPASTKNTGETDHEYKIAPDDLKRL
ncbi:MAG: cupin domain-containing protein [Planctomycetota bacterium]|jgi:mannose-6-phosphate isomerase-like protein (cupin superfamily)